MKICELDRIILASSSPRRIEILSRLGINVIVEPQDIEEVTDMVAPSDIVCELSIKKLGKLPWKHTDIICVAADTIVWLDGKRIGKPKDAEDARRILSVLSGKTHEVYTGFSISYKGKIYTDYEVSTVTMNTLSAEFIDTYVKSGSPMDKAGAYGIQDIGLTAGYNGDYDNIVGLPYNKFYTKLEEIIKDMNSDNWYFY